MFRIERLNPNLTLQADPGAGGGGGDPPADPPADFPAWMDQLPDEFKKDAELAKSATLGDLVKTHKGLGEKVAAIPAVPGKVEEYEFDKVEYPDDLEASGDDEFEKQYREVVLKAGLGKDQAKVVFAFFANTVLEQFKAAKAQFEAEKTACEETLKTEWKGDDFAKNMTLKDRFMADFVGENEELKKWFDESGAGNLPAFVKAAVEHAKKLGEDNLPPGQVKPAAKPEGREGKIREVYDHPDSQALTYGKESGGKAGADDRLKKTYPSMGGSG